MPLQNKNRFYSIGWDGSGILSMELSFYGRQCAAFAHFDIFYFFYWCFFISPCFLHFMQELRRPIYTAFLQGGLMIKGSLDLGAFLFLLLGYIQTKRNDVPLPEVDQLFTWVSRNYQT